LIQQETLLVEVLEQCTQVLLVLFLRGGDNQHAFYIGITEIQVSENLIDEPLKCLRGVSEPKLYVWEFEKPEGHDDGFPTSKLLRKVGNVPNGILVGDRPSIQSKIVATGSPADFFFGDEVEGQSERRPVPFRSNSSKTDFAIRRRSSASRRGREVSGCTGVMRM